MSEKKPDQGAQPEEDIVERARELEERAGELEDEEHAVEEHERDARTWLSSQPTFHWPKKPEDDGADEDD